MTSPFIDQNSYVITDLDGSLLDHSSYSFEASLPGIERLNDLSIPWSVCTSKTWSEVRELLPNLKNSWPAIVENGGGIYIPERLCQPNSVFKWTNDLTSSFQKADEGYVCLPLGASREKINKAIGLLNEKFKFETFSSLSAEEVSTITGLDLASARKASTRDFSENLVFRTENKGSNLPDKQTSEAISGVLNELEGVKVQVGGRFISIIGESDKGHAAGFLIDSLSRKPSSVVSLGDGRNDLPLFLRSDYAVVLRSPVNEPPLAELEKLTSTTKNSLKTFWLSAKLGPEGWSEEVGLLLDRKTNTATA